MSLGSSEISIKELLEEWKSEKVEKEKGDC